MQDRDDTSFDPRTWAGQNAAPGSPPRDAHSFDPLSWADPAVPPDLPPEPKAPTKAPPAEPGRFRHLWMGGAAAALLIAGGVAVFLAPKPQPSQPSPVPVAVTSPEAAPTAAPTLATRTLMLAGSIGLAPALADAGIAQDQAMEAARAALNVLADRAGEVRAVLTLDLSSGEPQLARLETTFEDSSGALVVRDAAGAFTASAIAPSLSPTIMVVRGEMDAESFYSSAVAAGVTDTLIPEFARAFAFDFDFQREIRPGDIFEAAFEQQKNAAGQPVGRPKLLYASMNTEAKSRALYWFQPPGEEPGWFDGNGASIVRSLMRTPVDGARVTSKFGPRMHPIRGFVKNHNGTDFAAPTGTPIYASGNAVVEFAAPRGAAGNFVKLRHDNGWHTWYMHLNAFAPGLAPGMRVNQGQTIGEVGTTGGSTGPHLHYEVRIDGAPVDPLSIQTESGRTLAGDARAAFIQERDRIDTARASRGG